MKTQKTGEFLTERHGRSMQSELQRPKQQMYDGDEQLFKAKAKTRIVRKCSRIVAAMCFCFERAIGESFVPGKWRQPTTTRRAVGVSQRFINTTNNGKYVFLDPVTGKAGERKLSRYKYV